MHLEGAAGPGDATAAVARPARASSAGDIGGLRGLDATLEAMKPARELREASRQMGRQTLRVAAALTGASRRWPRYLGRRGAGPRRRAITGWPSAWRRARWA